MTPRRRSNAKRGWPAHLYERKGYYSWRHPVTGEEYGLGRDRATAFAQALQANLHLAGAARKETLVERITGDGKPRTLAAWLETYEKKLEKRELAKNTRASYRTLARRALEVLGADIRLRAVTALQISEQLEAIAAGGQERTAQALRSFLRESFRVAIVAGWLDDNPVREVRTEPVDVKRARLTLEVFTAVYRSDISPWLRNAMALALVSAQRREDIALARFADIREDAWWVEQGKTGARIVLPLSLRLDAFGMSLGDVVKQCRGTGVLSRYLVHQTDVFGNSARGQQIWKDTVSRRFTDALAALKLDFGTKTPPTFHEIRSLSERLYDAQGDIKTQELLGHRDPKSTSIYHDPRGEWIRVQVRTPK